MKILQINVTYNHGGAGKIVKYLHDYYMSIGIDSRVVYGRGLKVNDINVYKMSFDWETKLHALVARIIGINGYMSQISTHRLIKYIKKENPDVIHLHGIHGYYVNLKMLFRFLKCVDKPIIWTFHDDWAFTGNCGYFYTCHKWLKGCHDCAQIKDYPKSYFFDFTSYMWKVKNEIFTNLKNVIIVSPSEWLNNDAKKSMFSIYKNYVINNGIDTKKIFYDRDKRISREKHNISLSDKVVLCVAYDLNNPRKGLKYVLDLVKDLENREDIKFVFIGWDNKYDSIIKKLKNIITFPFTNKQDTLAEFYSLADVFLISSIAENYATTVIESMACGTNVIGFNTGGIPEQLADRRGIVVDVGNQEKLKTAVLSILDKEADICNKEEIVNYIHGNNSIKVMAERYISLYNEAIISTDLK